MMVVRWGRYKSGKFREEGMLRTKRIMDAGTEASFPESMLIELPTGLDSDGRAVNPLHESRGNQLEFRMELWLSLIHI